jgi:predicted  nucleic acid-binding Zn-ribbon protein
MVDGPILQDGVALQAYYREVDATNRRVDALESRVQALDEHGSRGMDGLRVELRELSKDMASLETTFAAFRNDLRRSRFWLVGAYLGGLVPLYAFIADQFLN